MRAELALSACPGTPGSAVSSRARPQRTSWQEWEQVGKGAGAAAPPPSLPLPGAPVPPPGRGGMSSTFTSPVLASPSMCKSPSSSRPAGLASGPVAAAMARRASLCAGLGCGELTTSESPWFIRPCGEWGKGIESRFDSGKKTSRSAAEPSNLSGCTKPTRSICR